MKGLPSSVSYFQVEQPHPTHHIFYSTSQQFTRVYALRKKQTKRLFGFLQRLPHLIKKYCSALWSSQSKDGETVDNVSEGV